MVSTEPDLPKLFPNLYHFTDVRNLGSIRERGGIFSLAHLVKHNVHVDAFASDQASRNLDLEAGLGRYVRLCLTDSHPMAFVARQQNRIGQHVYLRIDPGVLTRKGVMFAPGIAYASGIALVTLRHAVDTKLIDFEAFGYLDWHQPELHARRAAVEKYEVLVPNCVPLDFITNMPKA